MLIIGKWQRRGVFALFLVLGLACGVVTGYVVQWKLLPKKAKANDVRLKTKTTSSKKHVEKKKEKPRYSEPKPIDLDRAQMVMNYLSTTVGPRPKGTPKEVEASQYLKARLEELGYTVGMQEFPLPGGTVSRNLICSDPGTSKDKTFVVSGHMDSRPVSPGANDDASGCSLVVELARAAKGTKHVPEIRFIIFGAEEDLGTKSSIGRQGSQFYVNNLPPEEKSKIVGMVSADIVSVGPRIDFRDFGLNSPKLADAMVAAGIRAGLNVKRNPNQLSDHQPFGQAGVPAVWMERLTANGNNDPKIHTAGDNITHVNANLVVECGNFLRDYLLGLNEESCRLLSSPVSAPPPPSTPTQR